MSETKTMNEIICTTKGEWGVSVLDKELDGTPKKEGAMIVTPPPAESLRRIRDRDYPYTSRRIAMLEASHYVSHEECVANAYVMAAAPELLEACQSVLKAASGADSEERFGELVTECLEKVRSAVEKATASTGANETRQ